MDSKKRENPENDDGCPEEKKVCNPQKELLVESTSNVAVVESTPDSSTNADKPLYPTVINKEVKEGENGTLFIEIKFYGTSKTEIFVYVNGKQYEGENTCRFYPQVKECKDKDVYVARIVLNKANSQDSGSYTFLLVENERRVIVDIELDIERKFDRLWLTEPATCTHLQDGTLRLKFGIRSFLNNFTTKWFHNHQQIPQSQFTKRYAHKVDKIDDENFEIYLDIKRPMLKDNAGAYYCLAQSNLNTLRANFDVNLDDHKPVIEKNPTIELEQEGNSSTLVLTVEYNSEQDVIVQWRHERSGLFIEDSNDSVFEINTQALDTPNTFSTQLRVKNYKSNTHGGLYSCELENTYGLMVAEIVVEE